MMRNTLSQHWSRLLQFWPSVEKNIEWIEYHNYVEITWPVYTFTLYTVLLCLCCGLFCCVCSARLLTSTPWLLLVLLHRVQHWPITVTYTRCMQLLLSALSGRGSGLTAAFAPQESVNKQAKQTLLAVMFNLLFTSNVALRMGHGLQTRYGRLSPPILRLNDIRENDR